MLLRLTSTLAGLALAATVLTTIEPSPARASDQDAVRGAVESGEIRPLTDILAIVRDKLPGKVVGVKIERKRDRWVYEFRAADAGGRLFEVYVDARSGEIERIKEK